MALQGSGAISASQIQTELGGANPISLSEYYRNGSYTGSHNTAVPTSGAISFSNFYGATAIDVTPAASDWGNISASAGGGGSTSASSNTVTITGINTSITLSATITSGSVSGTADNSFSGDMQIHAVVNGATVGSINVNNVSGTTTASFNVAVSNGATVYFVATVTVSDQLGGSAFGTGSGTITVRNATDGNATLDTFTVSVSAST